MKQEVVLADAAVSRSRIRILAATASTTGDAAETTKFNGLPTKTETETISTTTAAAAAAAAMIADMADLEMASVERMAAEETLTAVEAVEKTLGKVTPTTIGVEEEEEEEEETMTAEHGEEEEKLTELMIAENNGDAMEEADKPKNDSLREVPTEAEEEERKLKIGVEMEVPEGKKNKTGEGTKATEEEKNKSGGVEAREETRMIKMEG